MVSEKQRIEAMLSMMETDGWSYFLETVKNDAEVQNNLMAAKDEADLFYRKGALNVLTGIANYESTLKELWKQADEVDAA